MNNIIANLVTQLGLKPFQVENAVKLIDEGNTIPFIARYRKEVTGELDDQVLRKLYDSLMTMRSLHERREDVSRLIDAQGKLTEQISIALENAQTLTEIDDIYRPFRPKRRTRATIAAEKGLTPLAELILEQQHKQGDPLDFAAPYINDNCPSEQLALEGASDIICEKISDNAEYRRVIREMTKQRGQITSSGTKNDPSPVYSMYYDYTESISKAAHHRILAMDRGEREGFLSVSIRIDQQVPSDFLKSEIITGSIFDKIIQDAIDDSLKRLIMPSIEREIRKELTEKAQEQSISLFAVNLKNLIMQPPIRGHCVLGVDPGFRTGCKICVVDQNGAPLETGVIYCTLPHHDIPKAQGIVKGIIEKYNVSLVAIGNGTASRESESFVSEVIKQSGRDISYCIVNEAGASVYSASPLAAKEFPDYDVALRSAVSIARRLQDPLSELVKIDPKAIGVGQYQHDCNQKRLDETLAGVVEDCVNRVGADLNSASCELLSYVSGISKSLAQNIVDYRSEHGSFTNRQQLLKVKKLGPKAYLQCAGFLKIPGGENILDNTWVHPESYAACQSILDLLGIKDDFKNIRQQAKGVDFSRVFKEHNIGEPTLNDILDTLEKPGRDVRDDLPPVVLSRDVLEMTDLKPDMVLSGTVRNVIDFGAFVDIGVHQDGLVHISHISNKYIKHPTDVLSVGDVVKVRVLSVDVDKKRISLSMKNV